MRLHLRNIHLFREDDGELYNLTLSGGVKIGELENVVSEYYLIYSKRIIENPALELVIKQDFNSMKL
jgi:hypothetical protein